MHGHKSLESHVALWIPVGLLSLPPLQGRANINKFGHAIKACVVSFTVCLFLFRLPSAFQNKVINLIFQNYLDTDSN